MRRALGGDRLAEAESLTILGHLLGMTGRAAEGLAALREALALRRAALPPDDPRLVDRRGNLATALMHEGRHDEALPLLEQVVDAYASRAGVPHANLGVHQVDLAQALCATGRFDEGEAVFRGEVRRGRRVASGTC